MQEGSAHPEIGRDRSAEQLSPLVREQGKVDAPEPARRLRVDGHQQDP